MWIIEVRVRIEGLETGYLFASAKVVDFERQCWNNGQYSRRECME